MIKTHTLKVAGNVVKAITNIARTLHDLALGKYTGKVMIEVSITQGTVRQEVKFYKIFK